MQVLYEQYKRIFNGEYFGSCVRQLSSAETIAIGALAGASASFVSTPADVVKSRLMTTAAGSTFSTTQIIVDLIQKEGVMALFKGALFRAVWIAPLGAMNFAGYELAKRAMGVSRTAPGDPEKQKDVVAPVAPLEKRPMGVMGVSRASTGIVEKQTDVVAPLPPPADATASAADAKSAPDTVQGHTEGVLVTSGSELQSIESHDGDAEVEVGVNLETDGAQAVPQGSISDDITRVSWRWPWEKKAGVQEGSGQLPNAVCESCLQSRSDTM
jgi:hypothetical protein